MLRRRLPRDAPGCAWGRWLSPCSSALACSTSRCSIAPPPIVPNSYPNRKPAALRPRFPATRGYARRRRRRTPGFPHEVPVNLLPERLMSLCHMIANSRVGHTAFRDWSVRNGWPEMELAHWGIFQTAIIHPIRLKGSYGEASASVLPCRSGQETQSRSFQVDPQRHARVGPDQHVHRRKRRRQSPTYSKRSASCPPPSTVG